MTCSSLNFHVVNFISDLFRTLISVLAMHPASLFHTCTCHISPLIAQPDCVNKISTFLLHPDPRDTHGAFQQYLRYRSFATNPELPFLTSRLRISWSITPSTYLHRASNI